MSNNIRPTLIAYTRNTKNLPKEFEQFRYTLSNPSFFNSVPPKNKYQYFYVDSHNADEIRAVFQLCDDSIKEYKIGEDVGKAKSKALETEVKKEVETIKNQDVVVADENGDIQEIPNDLSELSWPELKSLASKFTDKKSFKKDEAIEILENAKKV